MCGGAKVLTFDPAQATELSTELSTEFSAELSTGFTTNPENEFVFDGTLQWEGWLRKLDRMEANYKYGSEL